MKKIYFWTILVIIVFLGSCNHPKGSTNESQQLFVEEVEDVVEEEIEEMEEEAEESTPTIVDSPDGSIRIIGYDNHTGGTSTSWSSMYQIRDKGKLYSYEGLPDWNGEMFLITAIYCLPHPTRNLYLFDAYFRICGSSAYQAFIAYERKGHELKRVAVLRDQDGSLTDEIGFEYNIPDYYFRFARALGYENLYMWDKDKKVFYYPLRHAYYGYLMTDKFVRYIWNKNTLEPTTDTVANPRLYAPLQDYVTCIQHTKAGCVQVRIDSMADGRLRYTAWDRNQHIGTEPDIVLYGKSVGDEYHFYNQKHTYVVTKEDEPEIRIYYSNTPGDLGELYKTYKEE